MAVVTVTSPLAVVVGIFRRYGLSIGNGALTIVVGGVAFWTEEFWEYDFVVWCLVSAQACLIGFWFSLADRSWSVRTVFSLLHLLGLVFCVLAAGQIHPDQRRAPYGLMEIIRDIPAMFVSSAVAGGLLRRRRWQLLTGATEDDLRKANSTKGMQVSLGEFMKWFTLLCVFLGLSVSLLPPFSFLREHWLGRFFDFSDYVKSSAVVCTTTGLVASMIFLVTLGWKSCGLPMLSRIAGIWCLAIVLWMCAAWVGINLLYNVYYVAQASLGLGPRRQLPDVFVTLETIRYGLPGYSFGILLLFLTAIIIVAITARLAGWRLRWTDA